MIAIYYPRTHGVEWGQSRHWSAEMLSKPSVEELEVGKNWQDQATKILNNQRIRGNCLAHTRVNHVFNGLTIPHKMPSPITLPS